MNYYEHHIGDFTQATAHLSFVEDAAYSRLIRKYYAEERPLPADIKAVQRLTGARTKEERQAIADMLHEFFHLEEDGWHNKRCDAEIARYRGKQEKARASAEARWSKRNAPAMRTHSENDANASTGNDANALRSQCEGNAHQSPVTRHQTPDIKNHHSEVSLSQPQPESRARPPENATRKGALCKQLRSLGINAAPHLQGWDELLPAYSDAEIIAAAEHAREKKPGERLHLNYLLPILQDRKASTPGTSTTIGSSRKSRIDNYAAQAAAARGEHGPKTEHDNAIIIDIDAERIA
jgi:uncharacterized protein YdaU (DUF1376 family)